MHKGLFKSIVFKTSLVIAWIFKQVQLLTSALVVKKLLVDLNEGKASLLIGKVH